jgi:hypothetical protein
MKLSIEMHDLHTDRYGVIHKDGCRDLTDGMPIGEACTLMAASMLADEQTGWDLMYDLLPEDRGNAYRVAPCARKELAR